MARRIWGDHHMTIQIVYESAPYHVTRDGGTLRVCKASGTAAEVLRTVKIIGRSRQGLMIAMDAARRAIDGDRSSSAGKARQA